MTTSPLLVRATIPDVSGIAADAATAQFVFASAGPVACEVAVIGFYTTMNTSQAMGGYFGQSRSRVANACTVQTYELDGFLHGEPHGSPISVQQFTLPAGAPTEAPDQCAVVLAYHGILSALPEHGAFATRPSDEKAIDEGAPATHSAKTRPRAELRGRQFFGPLSMQAIDTTSGDVTSTFVTDAKQALIRLAADAVAWAVWSRVGGLVTPIIGGWIDQELGVVRRRTDKTRTKLAWP